MIGTGANDPQKFDPNASRETLDHSIMYIFAVALQDGALAPRRQLRAASAPRARHGRAVAQDRDARRSRMDAPLPLAAIPNELAFGGRVEVLMQDGTVIDDELAVANAHPLGARPFGREDYIRKFRTLTDGIISRARPPGSSKWRRTCRRCRRTNSTCSTSPCPPARCSVASPASSEGARHA